MSFQDLEAGRPFLQKKPKEKDPSQAVAAGIFQMNTAVYSFNRLVNSLGTPKDTIELREKLLSIMILCFSCTRLWVLSNLMIWEMEFVVY